MTVTFHLPTLGEDMMKRMTGFGARRALPIAGVLAVVPLVFALAGCGSDDSSGSQTVAVAEPAAATEQQTREDVAVVTADPGDYAFGAERGQMAEAIERTYKSNDASATWEGNTMVVSIDGDATEVVGVTSLCRILTMLLNEDDLVALEYPNGRIDCEEALEVN